MILPFFKLNLSKFTNKVRIRKMNYVVFDIETTEAIGPGEITDMEIAVISVYSSKTDKIESFLTKDFNQMWPIFEKADALIGYNSEKFDIPILNKYYPGDLTNIKSIDILNFIKKSYGRRLKLDDVANATLGVGKTAHGLDAIEWWKNGEVEKVIKYCESDVMITKKIFDFANENGFLNFKDFTGKKIKIPIDTSDWNKKDGNKITFSMGF